MNQQAPTPSFGGERFVIYLMTFIMGGCGIAYEYTFSKISSDLLGNSVQQWAITIGLMMFFMGIGSDLQKHFKDKYLFDKFILFEILLGLVGSFGPLLLLWSFGNARGHYTLVQYSITIAVGFLIGLEIPILTRINEAFTPELKANIGGILRMDYVGAFMGALVWVFLLPHFFSLTQMSFVLGVFNLLTAMIALFHFRKLAHRKLGLFVLNGGCLLALVVGLYQAPIWSGHMEQKLYMDPIVYKATTRYQHIVLTQAASGDVFCYINGNTQFSSFDEYIYHEQLVHPAMMVAPRRKKVLVLGGGDGLGVRELLKYPDVESITLVDLDPEMTRLAAQNPYLTRINQNALANSKVKVVENGALIVNQEQTKSVFAPDQKQLFQETFHEVGKVSVVNLDATLFVDQISGVYDVIILDFPDPNNLELSKLYAKGFYQKVMAKLSRDGIVVQQATSPVHSREAFLCIGRTLQAAGFEAVPFHDNVPVFGEWGWWIATRPDGVRGGNLKQSLESIETLPVPTQYLTPELIHASLAFGRNTLKTKHSEINTILNNAVFRFYEDALTRGL